MFAPHCAFLPFPSGSSAQMKSVRCVPSAGCSTQQGDAAAEGIAVTSSELAQCAVRVST